MLGMTRTLAFAHETPICQAGQLFLAHLLDPRGRQQASDGRGWLGLGGTGFDLRPSSIYLVYDSNTI